MATQTLGADAVLFDDHFDLRVAEVRSEKLLGRRPAGAFWSATLSFYTDSGKREVPTQS
ncbi:MAG TPA: hypothetical protein VKM54_13355 [Myxococcota bacterium]|nr:hypothetical protein [Myxococcota bacterium]